MVSSRLYLLGGLVVALLAGAIWLFNFVEESGSDRRDLEILTDSLEVRERIDEAIRTSPGGRDDAIRLLEQFGNP